MKVVHILIWPLQFIIGAILMFSADMLGFAGDGCYKQGCSLFLEMSMFIAYIGVFMVSTINLYAAFQFSSSITKGKNPSVPRRNLIIGWIASVILLLIIFSVPSFMRYF